jgi:hypothetical protein
VRLEGGGHARGQHPCQQEEGLPPVADGDEEERSQPECRVQRPDQRGGRAAWQPLSTGPELEQVGEAG